MDSTTPAHLIAEAFPGVEFDHTDERSATATVAGHMVTVDHDEPGRYTLTTQDMSRERGGRTEHIAMPAADVADLLDALRGPGPR